MTGILWNITHMQQPASRPDCLIHGISMLRGKSFQSDELSRKLSSGNLSDPDKDRGIEKFANRHNLELTSFAQSHSLEGMTNMLKRGPILAFGQFTPDNKDPFAPGSTGHAFVIAGVRGNEILIHDPDEQISYWQDYGKTMEKSRWATVYTFQTREPWK